MNPEQAHETTNNKDIFTNEILALSSLPSFTGIAMNGLSNDYKKIIWWNLLTGTSFLFLFMILIGWMIFNITWYTWLFLIPPAIWLVIRIVTFNLTFKRKQYALRQSDIIYQSGWLFRTTTVVPYNRIQHISLHEGWLARKYQLANIKLYTTGDDLEIPGIPKEIAQKIQQLILNKIGELSGPNPTANPPARQSTEQEETPPKEP